MKGISGLPNQGIVLVYYPSFSVTFHAKDHRLLGLCLPEICDTVLFANLH